MEVNSASARVSTLATTNIPPNGRTYRSKKQRPCDICRSRRVQCKSLQRQHDGTAALCEMCVKLGLRCTFVKGPLRKRYREGSPQMATHSEAAHRATSTTETGTRTAPSDMPLTALSLSDNTAGPSRPPLPRLGASGTAVDVDSLLFPSNVPVASPSTVMATAAPDFFAMTDWWETMSTPPPGECVGLELILFSV